MPQSSPKADAQRVDQASTSTSISISTSPPTTTDSPSQLARLWARLPFEIKSMILREAAFAHFPSRAHQCVIPIRLALSADAPASPLYISLTKSIRFLPWSYGDTLGPWDIGYSSFWTAQLKPWAKAMRILNLCREGRAAVGHHAPLFAPVLGYRSLEMEGVLNRIEWPEPIRPGITEVVLFNHLDYSGWMAPMLSCGEKLDVMARLLGTGIRRLYLAVYMHIEKEQPRRKLSWQFATDAFAARVREHLAVGWDDDDRVNFDEESLDLNLDENQARFGDPQLQDLADGEDPDEPYCATLDDPRLRERTFPGDQARWFAMPSLDRVSVHSEWCEEVRVYPDRQRHDREGGEWTAAGQVAFSDEPKRINWKHTRLTKAMVQTMRRVATEAARRFPGFEYVALAPFLRFSHKRLDRELYEYESCTEDEEEPVWTVNHPAPYGGPVLMSERFG